MPCFLPKGGQYESNLLSAFLLYCPPFHFIVRLSTLLSAFYFIVRLSTLLSAIYFIDRHLEEKKPAKTSYRRFEQCMGFQFQSARDTSKLVSRSNRSFFPEIRRQN
jgi:hypothetical protein